MSKDDSAKSFELLLVFMLIVPSSLLSGWCVMTIWNLYMVPAKLPSLSLLPAWGLALCMSLGRNSSDAKDEKHPLQKTLISMAAQLIVVGISWVVWKVCQ